LRALDPADTANPAYDITAIYLRQVDDRLQIRVDLLGFQKAADLFLDIKIRDASAPAAEPFLIRIPSGDNSARISLDPMLATVTADVPLSEIPSRPRVDISTPEDEINNLTLDGPVPAQTAPLLLTFYDTFAGRFPAEALRSWDGAHTGPRGERHGLKHLLDAAEEYRIPIVLLDLKEPETLSALDAMGLLPQIQQMEQEGLLILPDSSDQGTALFGFSPNPFSWSGIPLRGTLTSRFAFESFSNPNHLHRPLFSQTTIIPVAAESDSGQPTREGPSIEVRRALLETALNSDEKDLLVLGGNFQSTTWGSPDMVGGTLAYFASRPYIQILTSDDLMNFPAKFSKPELRHPSPDESIDKLETHYQNLTRPVLDFVANWRGSPLSSCTTDLDQDGQPECILADEKYLAIFDPQGARMTYLFAVERDGREASPKGGIPPHLHQLIGPSWQVAPGIDAYPGAFADMDDPFKPYESAFEGNSLVFTSLDGTRTKTFKLTDTGLEVEYQTQEPVTTQIPLLVQPETRFTPGWANEYMQEKTPGGITWGLENRSMVSVQAEGPVTMRTFNESLSLLTTPEDPDFAYPAGHYVPFPMAVVEINVEEATSIIQIAHSP
jgi:hypothetical protein